MELKTYVIDLSNLTKTERKSLFESVYKYAPCHTLSCNNELKVFWDKNTDITDKITLPENCDYHMEQRLSVPELVQLGTQQT